MSREIFITNDGSHSLLHKELNETYHSVHGAIQESKHVFIENGLSCWWALNSHRIANVLEVGFGTGLNAFLSAMLSLESQVGINYASIEAFPLAREVWSRLNYPDSLGHRELFEKLHDVSWDSEHELMPSFRLTKYYSTLQTVKLLPEAFDVVYFDAFAPSKQPEMWDLSMLEKVVNALAPGGILVTYCARGQVKRDLASLGLAVETLSGPPGKKEMTRASKT